MGPRVWNRVGLARWLGASVVGGVSIALLLALSPSATARADAPTRVQRKAYRDLRKDFKGQLAISYTQVKQGEATVEQQLAPCVSALKDPSVPPGVAQALLTELQAQYFAVAGRPFVEIDIAQDVDAERLPIGRKSRAAVELDAAQDTAALPLNTCADEAAWQAAGFAPAAEPSGIQAAIAYLKPAVLNGATVLWRILTVSQRWMIEPLITRLNAYVPAVIKTLGRDLSDWRTSQGLPDG